MNLNTAISFLQMMFSIILLGIRYEHVLFKIFWNMLQCSCCAGATYLLVLVQIPIVFNVFFVVSSYENLFYWSSDLFLEVF